MLENTEGQSKMDNQEKKLANQRTQDEEKQTKNTTQYVLDTTICVRHHFTQTNTKNVSKT